LNQAFERMQKQAQQKDVGTNSAQASSIVHDRIFAKVLSG